MSNRDDWSRVKASLKGARNSDANDSANLVLDLAPPISGKAEDVADLPALKMPEAATPVESVRTTEGQALRDFQSSLTNTVEERENTSNLLHFWERIPRYHCGHIRGVTSSTDAKQVDIVNYTFEDNGERYTLEMTPAQIRVEENGVEQTLFCYPDSTDELVELALIKIAMENGDILEINTTARPSGKGGRFPSYGVHFTINQLMDMLRTWGRSRTYASIRRSLDVLHKCNLSIEADSQRGISASAPILSELISYKQNGFRGHDRNGFWTVRFHPIVSLGIHAGLYQQFNLYRTATLKSSVAQAVAKLIVLEGRNISSSIPYALRFSRFREMTGMLNYKRLGQARKKFCTDIQTLITDGMLLDVEFIEIKRGKRVIDIEARMYASQTLVKEMKASHKRNSILQQRRQMRTLLSTHD